MKSFALVPYSPDFPAHCEDWHELLVQQAHRAAKRTDHYREDSVVQLFDSEEWLTPYDMRVTPDRVKLKGLMFWFRGEPDA